MLTLLEIARHSTMVLGIEDAATLEYAKQFVRNRWSMLWHAELWPQARWVQTGLAVAAGQTEVTLDPLFELATCVRLDSAGRMLSPAEEITALLLDPTAWDQPGLLDAFATLPPDPAGAVRLRLLSPPASADTLTVMGKRTPPPLADDTAKPIIPGADLALVAYTTADLYEWQRQMTKSQAKQQEAAALEQRMRDLATAQSARIARIIPADY